ncbi:hypothetical protein KIPB_003273 [Kipferlia bialata]|uniref:Uncharacterized protein n=1 Tax=Kipferlia bialata TaxID=797122 RepID=A0A391NJZ0_9EUKA|nr:hypothetical protein KIPB_003273 [Kipferlia bialata]|eukprot:g3273.t1
MLTCHSRKILVVAAANRDSVRKAYRIMAAILASLALQLEAGDPLVPYQRPPSLPPQKGMAREYMLGIRQAARGSDVQCVDLTHMLPLRVRPLKDSDIHSFCRYSTSMPIPPYLHNKVPVNVPGPAGETEVKCLFLVADQASKIHTPPLVYVSVREGETQFSISVLRQEHLTGAVTDLHRVITHTVNEYNASLVRVRPRMSIPPIPPPVSVPPIPPSVSGDSVRGREEEREHVSRLVDMAASLKKRKERERERGSRRGIHEVSGGVRVGSPPSSPSASSRQGESGASERERVREGLDTLGRDGSDTARVDARSRLVLRPRTAATTAASSLRRMSAAGTTQMGVRPTVLSSMGVGEGESEERERQVSGAGVQGDRRGVVSSTGPSSHHPSLTHPGGGDTIGVSPVGVHTEGMSQPMSGVGTVTPRGIVSADHVPEPRHSVSKIGGSVSGVCPPSAVAEGAGTREAGGDVDMGRGSYHSSAQGGSDTHIPPAPAYESISHADISGSVSVQLLTVKEEGGHVPSVETGDDSPGESSEDEASDRSYSSCVRESEPDDEDTSESEYVGPIYSGGFGAVTDSAPNAADPNMAHPVETEGGSDTPVERESGVTGENLLSPDVDGDQSMRGEEEGVPESVVSHPPQICADTGSATEGSETESSQSQIEGEIETTAVKKETLRVRASPKRTELSVPLPGPEPERERASPTPGVTTVPGTSSPGPVPSVVPVETVPQSGPMTPPVTPAAVPATAEAQGDTPFVTGPGCRHRCWENITALEKRAVLAFRRDLESMPAEAVPDRVAAFIVDCFFGLKSHELRKDPCVTCLCSLMHCTEEDIDRAERLARGRSEVGQVGTESGTADPVPTPTPAVVPLVRQEASLLWPPSQLPPEGTESDMADPVLRSFPVTGTDPVPVAGAHALLSDSSDIEFLSDSEGPGPTPAPGQDQPMGGIDVEDSDLSVGDGLMFTAGPAGSDDSDFQCDSEASEEEVADNQAEIALFANGFQPLGTRPRARDRRRRPTNALGCADRQGPGPQLPDGSAVSAGLSAPRSTLRDTPFPESVRNAAEEFHNTHAGEINPHNVAPFKVRFILQWLLDADGRLAYPRPRVCKLLKCNSRLTHEAESRAAGDTTYRPLPPLESSSFQMPVVTGALALTPHCRPKFHERVFGCLPASVRAAAVGEFCALSKKLDTMPKGSAGSGRVEARREYACRWFISNGDPIEGLTRNSVRTVMRLGSEATREMFDSAKSAAESARVRPDGLIPGTSSRPAGESLGTHIGDIEHRHAAVLDSRTQPPVPVGGVAALSESDELTDLAVDAPQDTVEAPSLSGIFPISGALALSDKTDPMLPEKVFGCLPASQREQARQEFCQLSKRLDSMKRGSPRKTEAKREYVFKWFFRNGSRIDGLSQNSLRTLFKLGGSTSTFFFHNPMSGSLSEGLGGGIEVWRACLETYTGDREAVLQALTRLDGRLKRLTRESGVKVRTRMKVKFIERHLIDPSTGDTIVKVSRVREMLSCGGPTYKKALEAYQKRMMPKGGGK